MHRNLIYPKYFVSIVIGILAVLAILGGMYITAKESDKVPKASYGIPAECGYKLYTAMSSIDQIANDEHSCLIPS